MDNVIAACQREHWAERGVWTENKKHRLRKNWVTVKLKADKYYVLTQHTKVLHNSKGTIFKEQSSGACQNHAMTFPLGTCLVKIYEIMVKIVNVASVRKKALIREKVEFSNYSCCSSQIRILSDCSRDCWLVQQFF